MSDIFDSFGTEHHEEKGRDVLGFQPLDTDLYRATVKMAYLNKAKSGAMSVAFEFDLGGKSFKKEIYFTNAKGENFFMTKPKDSSKPKSVSLPGMTVVNDICIVTTGESLKAQRSSAEKKMVNVYNFDLKKDVPTEVTVLVGLLGKQLALAITKVVENKKEKQGEEWVPTSEEVTTNEIEKAVFFSDGRTVSEWEKKDEAKWAEGWVKRNRGQVKKKLTWKGGTGGSSSGGGTPPASDRKPLFG